MFDIFKPKNDGKYGYPSKYLCMWNGIHNIIIIIIIYLSIYVIYSQDSIYYVEINYVQYICRTLATLLAIFHLLFNCFSYPEPKTTTTTSSFNNDHKHFNNNNNNIEEKDPLSSGYRNYIHPYHQKHQTNNVIYFFFFLSFLLLPFSFSLFSLFFDY